VTTPDDKKAREFWVEDRYFERTFNNVPVMAHIAYSPNPFTGKNGFFHVIEFSAYETLKRELAEVTKEMDGEIYLRDLTFEKLSKERAQLTETMAMANELASWIESEYSKANILTKWNEFKRGK
jgi:hypothetical protein